MSVAAVSPPDSMYLVLPVPFRIQSGKLQVETQAANGLDRWADHFSKITVAAPVVPHTENAKLAGFTWSSVNALQHRDRIDYQPLPWVNSPASFVRSAGDTRRLIGSTVRQSRHLQFAIGGLLGDWGGVAALEAIRQNRRFAIHTDRVEHEVLREVSANARGLRRLKVRVQAPLMARYHQYLIHRAALGLWHGGDCFRAYSPWCQESHLIHSVHTKPCDAIDAAALDRKVNDIRSSDTLQLCYAGRLDPMKGPLEWLRAIAAARDLGVRLRATWYGEGSLLEQARAESKRLNLDGIVSYPGFIAERAQLLGYVRAAHAMVFTHVTRESPRSLLESLVSGTPILGYSNSYASDLLEVGGGGSLVPTYDFRALGEVIARMAKSRERLVELVRQAAANGRRFSDVVVFAERSRLLKQFA